MSDKEVVDKLAQIAAINCYGRGAICTCGAVTEIWEEIYNYVIIRAIKLKLRDKFGQELGIKEE